MSGLCVLTFEAIDNSQLDHPHTATGSSCAPVNLPRRLEQILMGLLTSYTVSPTAGVSTASRPVCLAWAVYPTAWAVARPAWVPVNADDDNRNASSAIVSDWSGWCQLDQSFPVRGWGGPRSDRAPSRARPSDMSRISRRSHRSNTARQAASFALLCTLLPLHPSIPDTWPPPPRAPRPPWLPPGPPSRPTLAFTCSQSATGEPLTLAG